MIVLDTNVLSELMRPQPHSGIANWVASQRRSLLYTTSITQAELLYGVGLLPKGKRRDALAAAVDAIFVEDFAGRVLSFDSAAAVHYARIVLKRRECGEPIEGFDALIAATTASAGFGIATRDVEGFRHCGIDVVDPWHAG